MADDKAPEEQLNNLTVNDDDDVVDPWNVSGKSETGIDYDKLISKYLLKKKLNNKTYLSVTFHYLTSDDILLLGKE